MPIIERKIVPDSIIYPDSWKDYNVLDVSAFKHFRINYSEPFADKRNHIKGIESFWSQAKRHMRIYNGIKPDNCNWFLQEYEWRFNGGNHADLLK